MAAVQPKTVRAGEARTRFSELLDEVERGGEIVITCHGHPVARLVPVRPASSQESRRAAIEAMRQLAAGHRPKGLRVKDLVVEGRK